jgi:hypothetical protein
MDHDADLFAPVLSHINAETLPQPTPPSATNGTAAVSVDDMFQTETGLDGDDDDDDDGGEQGFLSHRIAVRSGG